MIEFMNEYLLIDYEGYEERDNNINTKDNNDGEDTISENTCISGVVDNTQGNISIPVSDVNTITPKQKFSSSMKFYLLKKKFMKQTINYNTYLENDLTYEDYLIV